MSFDLQCACGKPLKVPEGYPGEFIRCPVCEVDVPVAWAAQPAPSTEPPPAVMVQDDPASPPALASEPPVPAPPAPSAPEPDNFAPPARPVLVQVPLPSTSRLARDRRTRPASARAAPAPTPAQPDAPATPSPTAPEPAILASPSRSVLNQSLPPHSPVVRDRRIYLASTAVLPESDAPIAEPAPHFAGRQPIWAFAAGIGLSVLVVLLVLLLGRSGPQPAPLPTIVIVPQPTAQAAAPIAPMPARPPASEPPQPRSEPPPQRPEPPPQPRPPAEPPPAEPPRRPDPPRPDPPVEEKPVMPVPDRMAVPNYPRDWMNVMPRFPLVYGPLYKGTRQLTIENPLNYPIKVALISWDFGTAYGGHVIVPARGSQTVKLRNREYVPYYQLAIEPHNTYVGERFTLNNSGTLTLMLGSDGVLPLRKLE